MNSTPLALAGKRFANALPTSTNHIPPSGGESGTTGHYYKLIGIYDVPFSPADPIEYQPVSSPSWECIDREFKNLGDGAKIHKTTTNDKQEFRSLKGTGITTGTTKQGKVVFEENGDVIEGKVYFSEDDLGGDPDEGEVQTGDFNFVDEAGIKINTGTVQNPVLAEQKFDNRFLVEGVTQSLPVQVPLVGDDFHTVDNDKDPSQVQLLNNNQYPADPLNPDKNNKPKRGTTGWYPVYVALAGEVAGASVYMTTPTELAKDANGNLLQTPKDVTEQSVNIQADGNALPVKHKESS